MKISGTIIVQAPRPQVYKALRDARLFASCVEGVRDLVETGPDAYSAMFETKVAYMKFAFKVTVQVVRADEPREIEAKIEGAPVGIVGRLTATSVTRLTETAGATRIDYDVDTALTGKLGSLGQPVLRAKAKEMERQFAARLAEAFAAPAPGPASKLSARFAIARPIGNKRAGPGGRHDGSHRRRAALVSRADSDPMADFDRHQSRLAIRRL